MMISANILCQLLTVTLFSNVSKDFTPQAKTNPCLDLVNLLVRRMLKVSLSLESTSGKPMETCMINLSTLPKPFVE